MPRRAVDYSKTVIYKIQHNEDESLLYVGSTTDFTNRKSKHKCACNNQTSPEYDRRVYRMIRENGGWDSFSMVKIEDIPCKDKREAECREDQVMRELRATMNANRAFIEDQLAAHRVYNQTYVQAHPERRTETLRLYRDTHRDMINAKCYCEACNCHVSRSGLSRHRRSDKHNNNIVRLMEQGAAARANQ